MPDKTPGERVVEEWEMVCGQLIAMDHDELVKRIDTLLAEQSAGLVLDFRETPKFGIHSVAWDKRDVLEAIRTQLPGVKVLT